MGARILVADDSVTIQKVVELTFSKEGFELIPARSGEEAIHRARERRPDLMLIDLVMPDKGGYEVCKALRADPLLKDVPIILLTGTFEPFDKAEGARVGANDFVTKPFESQALLSKVRQLLFAREVKGGLPAGPQVAPPPAAPAQGEVSAETLWELLEAEPVPSPPKPPPTAPPPAAPPELSLDELVQAPAPPTAPGEIALEDLRTEPAPVAPGGEISLEDLTAPAAPSPPGEISLDDLMGAPPAPAGELSLDELVQAPAPPTAPGEIALEDLTAAVRAESAAPAPLDLETFGEETRPGAEVVEEGPPVFELEPAPFDLPIRPVEAEAGEAAVRFAAEAAPAPVASPPTAAVELEPAAAVPEAGVEAAALPRAAADEIADRVVKDLSEKLLHRIEQIVWEVVPELAEILITREIERVKATVQGKKAS